MPIFAAQVSELLQFLPSGRYGAQSESDSLSAAENVCLWHLADITERSTDVRFWE
jgi:hypothetical protein